MLSSGLGPRACGGTQIKRGVSLIQAIAFYLFAIVVIGSGAMTISSRNPVHSVMWLILAFFNAAGLMVLVGAEFIAMLLVIVYVGAVAVLFLFVVMMLDIDVAEMRAGVARYFMLGLALAVALAAEILIGVGAWSAGGVKIGRRAAPIDVAVPNIQAIGDLLYTRYLFRVRRRGAGPAGRDDRRDRADASPAWRGTSAEHRAAECTPTRRGNAQHAADGWRRGAAVIGLTHYLVVAAILFTMGVLGIFLNRKNLIVILMAIELILLAVNLNLVAFSAYLHDLVGQVFAMFVLTVAAGEAAIGLAILVIYFRGRGTIAVDDVNRMKG